MLGHSSVQLTLDTYSHLLPDLQLKERAAARLDALLRDDADNCGQNYGQDGEKVVSQMFASWNRMSLWLRVSLWDG
jgi:hypothetical protein